MPLRVHDFPSESDVLGWRIWYSDGRIFNSREHSWALIPATGFVVCMLYFAADWAEGKPYRRILEAKRIWFSPTQQKIGESEDLVDTNILAAVPDALIKVNASVVEATRRAAITTAGLSEGTV